MSTKGCSSEDLDSIVFPTDVTKHNWFWGVVSRDEVNSWMQGCEEGTFLIRQSSSHRECYTLTVRKDGFGRMFNIHKNDEGPGVYVDLSSRQLPNEQYDSLVAFVEHYRDNKLTSIDSRLNTCLTHPLVRPKIKTGDKHSVLFDVALSIANAHVQLMKFMRVQNWIYDMNCFVEQELEQRTSASVHYNTAVDWLEGSRKNLLKNKIEFPITSDDHKVIAQSQLEKYGLRIDSLRTQIKTIDNVKKILQTHHTTLQAKPRILWASHFTNKHIWVMRHQYDKDDEKSILSITEAVYLIIHQLTLTSRDADARSSTDWTLAANVDQDESQRLPGGALDDGEVDVALPVEISSALNMGDLTTPMSFAKKIMMGCDGVEGIVTAQQRPIVNQIVLRCLTAIDDQFERLYDTLEGHDGLIPRPPRRTISMISKGESTYEHRLAPTAEETFSGDDEADDEWPIEHYWFPDLSTSEANKRLAMAPNGTFLVRVSASKAPWLAVSLVNQKAVTHCLVKYEKEMELLSFYFNEHSSGTPHFKTLSDFINFYRRNTLKTHNPALDTCLVLPIVLCERMAKEKK